MFTLMAFGDIHEYVHPLAALEQPLRQADVIVVTGDMTRWRGPETAAKVLEAIAHYNPAILAQVGNTDTWETHHYLEERGINLHAQGYTLGPIGIFGAGGSNFTPFYTPSELSEEEIAETLLRGYEKVQHATYTILIAHCPPFQTAVDRLYDGTHVGSTSVRRFIEMYQPDLCISGHIHESPGEDRLGNTLLVNPGMLAQGGYVTVALDGEGLRVQRTPGHDRRHYTTSPFMPSSL